MKEIIQRLFPFLILGAFVSFFFFPFLLFQKLPIPADTIIGLYHPYRDLYAKEYPNGIPFKNFLITDVVRQLYPWRVLAVAETKAYNMPLWNPYSLSGTPLLANMQSAALYPLNILFLIFSFSFAWSLLVLLQPLLGGFFLYLYLRHMRLQMIPSILGGVVYSFSGFNVAWMEWNTISHVALWLPLILLAKEKLLGRITLFWCFILVFAETSQIFAGHLQTYFYSFVLCNVYLLARILQLSGEKHNNTIPVLIIAKRFISFVLLGLLVFVISAVQWVSTLQFIQYSARMLDQADWQKEGWFIPWEHLIQFIAPDFFGNPTTLNYWGHWNYAEFVGYIGIIPLVFALFAILFRRDRKTLFFTLFLVFSLLFALPNVLSKIPFQLQLPFLASSQPTRLLFITDFTLAVLAALGFDFFLRTKKPRMVLVIGIVGLVFMSLWGYVLFGKGLFQTVFPEHLITAKRNLYLPTILFGMSIPLFLSFLFVHRLKKKETVITSIFACLLLLLTMADLFRFAYKFTPFTQKEYLFPTTNAITFLQEHADNYRIMATDSRILPPNFSIMYRLQSIEGYDPLYLARYGELIIASERGKPDITPPWGFNRIITPHNYESKIIDLLGVKYILSLQELKSPKLKEVAHEGQTRIYENTAVLPRAFFVEAVSWTDSKEETITQMFEKDRDMRKTAIVEKPVQTGDRIGAVYPTRVGTGTVKIVIYEPNKVILETNNTSKGFLVLTDAYYPSWVATVYPQRDVVNAEKTRIYKTDYNFRGIFVPAGKNTIEFVTSLTSNDILFGVMK